ncbi:Glycosyl hydrolase family 26 [Verrucomicrobium sp. GAS474]|uniref:glycoside hydrolase family 26 protein n=1 Tax=Verrucomicrobium sp. GAS474 TaxID=1882831 RepID=UPI00087CEC29|nr:glycosyl hydrolase [Verrucomicrobium sp. GAS474]SDU05877.1 Glycosyl hydrolase family 26 [Verrucomicrobium sp. GAS474]
MNPAVSLFLRSALLLSGAGLPLFGQVPSEVPDPAPLPLTHNTAPPYTVVEAGVAKMQAGYMDFYSDWIKRPLIWGEDFMPTDNWDNIQGNTWFLAPWAKWVKGKEGRRLILSAPMLVGNWKREGPKTGPDAGKPVSHEIGATGAYNVYYKTLAERLVANGLGDTIIRLGWEFNGGWYVWRVDKNPDAFIQYWRQIVTTMRAVPGAEKLKFCWNPTIGLYESKAYEAWPGDEYVDILGLDIYDQTWYPEIYPLPEKATPEEIEKRRRLSWDGNLNFDGKRRDGIPFWTKFAQEHGNKPIAVCEWGLVAGKHGGGDNVYFIEQMYKFITDPKNNVYFHCYFDVNAPDGGHLLAPWKGVQSVFPNAVAKYQELFGAKEPYVEKKDETANR